MRHPSGLVALVTAAALLIGAAGCNSAAEETSGLQQGGTLQVAMNALPSRLDPQRISAALDANISRLLSRTLTTFKSEPGAASSELAVDLATDLGRPSENNTVWEFRLRDNVKWADGSAIICQHLKYGAERNFANFADGLPYARNYLKDNAEPYKGPFVGGNVGLASVECIDNKTVRYHLKQPVGDFNYSVGLPIFAPVKLGADSDDAAFNLAPLSSGPYKVKPGSRTETQMVLVRNEFWDRSTDKVRKAYPDEIVLKQEKNVPALTNSLIEDAGDARNTISLNQDVSANFVQQVMTDSTLTKRTASGPSGAVRYFAINVDKIKNEKCRQAFSFAFNKRKYRQMMGGALLGELATTMLPPNLRAHQKFDHYNTLATNGDGDAKRAMELIAQAKSQDNVVCPTKLTVTFPENPTTVTRYVRTLVEAYLEIGVQVTLKPLPAGDYWDLISEYEMHSQADLVYAGWIPDWANGSAVIPPLFKGTEVAAGPGQRGGSNYSYMNLPEINQAIEEAMAESTIERQWKLWGEIDSKLSQMAATIPVLYPNAIRLHGSNVGGAFIHSGFGMPDLCALGLLAPGGTPS